MSPCVSSSGELRSADRAYPLRPSPSRRRPDRADRRWRSQHPSAQALRSFAPVGEYPPCAPVAALQLPIQRGPSRPSLESSLCNLPVQLATSSIEFLLTFRVAAVLSPFAKGCREIPSAFFLAANRNCWLAPSGPAHYRGLDDELHKANDGVTGTGRAHFTTTTSIASSNVRELC
jgi:hypothetical protein